MQTMTRTPDGRAMPEFLTRRHDLPTETSPWVVNEGQAQRGAAWTALDERRMQVPYGTDEFARLVRAHEMMHARISPVSKDACAVFDSIDPRTVEMAEEFRVNTMLARAGFDTAGLIDGSENLTGQRLTERKDWRGAVGFLAAVAGTGASKEFIKGVRKENPEWAKALREVEKALTKAAKNLSTFGLSDTTRASNGLPSGFMSATKKFAHIIHTAEEAGDPSVSSEDGEQVETDEKDVSAEEIKNALKSGRGSSGTGGFAPLMLKAVPLPRRVSGSLGRKRIASNIGRNPRRIHRLVTDPHKRVFDRTVRGQGGVVLIDQSGSMHLDDRDLWEILEAAPGCVVIGYSHRPGSTGIPNVWVMAERGKVCETVPSGNGGNGVDGPALRFAITKRRTNEPIVWVCDGDITDSTDRYFPGGTEECAELIVRHGVHTVSSVKGAVDALQRAARGERLGARATGALKNTRAWMGRD